MYLLNESGFKKVGISTLPGVIVGEASLDNISLFLDLKERLTVVLERKLRLLNSKIEDAFTRPSDSPSYQKIIVKFIFNIFNEVLSEQYVPIFSSIKTQNIVPSRDYRSYEDLISALISNVYGYGNSQPLPILIKNNSKIIFSQGSFYYRQNNNLIPLAKCKIDSNLLLNFLNTKYRELANYAIGCNSRHIINLIINEGIRFWSIVKLEINSSVLNSKKYNLKRFKIALSKVLESNSHIQTIETSNLEIITNQKQIKFRSIAESKNYFKDLILDVNSYIKFEYRRSLDSTRHLDELLL